MTANIRRHGVIMAENEWMQKIEKLWSEAAFCLSVYSHCFPADIESQH